MNANVNYCGVVILLRKLVASGYCTKKEAGRIAARIAKQTGADKTYSIGTPRLSCPDFEQCCAEKCADFADWCRKMKAHSDIDREMAFVLWQSIVAPLGNYKEETILCNKEGMNAVWSWDNCFHALGVAKAFPALAFYQLQLVYDNLDAEGAMPDTICPFGVERGFTKPPVHAFIYAMRYLLNSCRCRVRR